MLDWAFGNAPIAWLAEQRSPPLTLLALAATGLGGLVGYVLVVTGLYVAWSKRVAVRLAVVALTAMLANHALKTWIAHPRPFVEAGSWRERWELPAASSASLVAEYSTPSGHAMAGAAFYGALWAWAPHPVARGLALLAVLATGASRPYLGVHYVGDIVVGWAIGGALAALAWRGADPLAAWWGARSQLARTGLLLASSLAVWIATLSAYADSAHGPPLAVASYLGLLTGVALAAPVEAERIGFEPTGASVARKLARFAVVVGLLAGSSLGLDLAFAAVAADDSLAGQALRYLRYAGASALGLLAGPWLFVRFEARAR